MTKCTGSRCTRHFGVICTHHQWLTQLSCLNTEFSPDVIETYLPYCSRSILAKAQLYFWVRSITDRTWLVDVGDATGLQDLSPASLAEGYGKIDVIYKAPECLRNSASASSKDSLRHVMASCAFTSATQHTGNAVRSWEYNHSQRSMTALDSETVGYDLTGTSIRYGDYFDKECLCTTFTMDPTDEPCSGSGELDLTKERLWINATCGSKSLPDDWTDTLRTTEYDYIPILDWKWPICFADIPNQVAERKDQCATYACQLNSSGYCNVKRVVDRACFCREIRYSSCGGLCHIFKTRIDYVKWLHNLCGNVDDWHGLPDDWRQLAAPTSLDITPWRWTVRPFNDSNTTHIPDRGSIGVVETCISNSLKIQSFALVNAVTFLALFLSLRRDIFPNFRLRLDALGWFSKGTLIAALQLLTYWLNAFLIQQTPGYENVPVAQLILLWCSMPRLFWLAFLLVATQPYEAMNLSAAASFLFAEIILQLVSSYYMIITINYGIEYDFYLGGLKGAAEETSAKLMYIGALMWLIVTGLSIIYFVRTLRRINSSTTFGSLKWQKRGRNIYKTPSIAEELIAHLTERCARLIGKLAYYWMENGRGTGESLLTSSDGEDILYGTFSFRSHDDWVLRKASVEIYGATAISMLLLCIAQWLFWSGFIGLSSTEFCPPKLGILTAVWSTFSVTGAVIGASL